MILIVTVSFQYCDALCSCYVNPGTSLQRRSCVLACWRLRWEHRKVAAKCLKVQFLQPNRACPQCFTWQERVGTRGRGPAVIALTCD